VRLVIFAKMHLRPTDTTTEKKKPERDGILKNGKLKPGDMVSINQYVCRQPGCLPNTYGKEKPHKQYQGGTIFVDEASGFIFVQHQVSLNATETI
jgi:hypothetical protein